MVWTTLSRLVSNCQFSLRSLLFFNAAIAVGFGLIGWLGLATGLVTVAVWLLFLARFTCGFARRVCVLGSASIVAVQFWLTASARNLLRSAEYLRPRRRPLRAFSGV
jgi:hypothetical protein